MLIFELSLDDRSQTSLRGRSGCSDIFTLLLSRRETDDYLCMPRDFSTVAPFCRSFPSLCTIFPDSSTSIRVGLYQTAYLKALRHVKAVLHTETPFPCLTDASQRQYDKVARSYLKPWE